MAVTELALLRLLKGTEASSPPFLANIRRAREVVEDASGRSFHYYQNIQAPQSVFIIGAWSSPEFHMQNFLPSEANQSLLHLLKDQVAVEWMFHLAIDPSAMKSVLQEDCLLISRYIIKNGVKDRFEVALEANKQTLESRAGRVDSTAGGFRLDRGFDPSLGEKDHDEEFVLFTGVEGTQQDAPTINGDGLTKSNQLQEYLVGHDFTCTLPFKLG